MSENNVEPGIVEPVAEEHSEPLETRSSDETPEQPETRPEEPQFRPWKKKAETEEPASIPYSRFKDVNDERRTLERRLEHAEAELSNLKPAKEPARPIEPDDIKIEDYKTPQEYLTAVNRANREAAVRDLRTEIAEREVARQRAQELEKINTAYLANLDKAIKVNPEIKDAADWLDRAVDQLGCHPAVAHELMRDSNVGDLIFKITTDQQFLNDFFRGDPSEVIRRIHRESARIETLSELHKDDPEESVEHDRDVIAARVPIQIRGVSSNSKNPENMTAAEYRAWRSRQH